MSLVQLSIGVDAATLVDWFDLLVENAEDDVHGDWGDVDPEEVLESLRSGEVQKWVLLISSDKEVQPAESTVYNDHISDYLPIILFENGVSADSINEAGDTWDGMYQLQMERSTPAIVLMLPVDVLLLLSEHEPVEGCNDEVSNDS